MAEHLPPALEALLGSARTAALATLKRDGRPQLSNVSCTWDPASRTVRFSTTDGRAKTANLRRDPRASLYATTPDFGAYAVAEGTAELTPVAADPHDAVVDELVEVYRLIQGEHPDWEEYRAAMVADRRLVVRLRVDRLYGWAPVDAPRTDD
ncbi:PPOX class F420-dependent oxidoreductase [Streptomyces sp. NPDC001380]|uniref:PPOX class F420-dependent oxidoreductase n=1 Tax=Streptomyces sp. NPDC001380 TaxID=3364566 RepID=UPI0036C685DA